MIKKGDDMKKKKQKTKYVDFGKVFPQIHNYSFYESPNSNYVSVTFSMYEITDDNKYEMTAEFSLDEDEIKEILDKMNKLKGVK